MEIYNIRKNIDDIDKQLVKLLCERFDCAKKIAQYKMNNNIDILNEKRELEVILKVTNYNINYSFEIQNVYETIINTSKNLQKNV